MVMAIWTRAELTSLLDLWKAAYKAAATGKSYTIAGRSLSRQDLPEIRKQLDYLEGQLEALDGKRGPVFVTARVRR